jgi:hypothetical protein
MSADGKRKLKGSSGRPKGPTQTSEAGSSKRNLSKDVGSDDVGAGIFTKLVFFLLLCVFAVVLVVNQVDYKAGQLEEAYEKHIPIEVSTILG